MSRYVAKGAMSYDHGDGTVSVTADTVFQDERAAVNTGLVDEHGRELYRLPDWRVGFDLKPRIRVKAGRA